MMESMTIQIPVEASEVVKDSVTVTPGMKLKEIEKEVILMTLKDHNFNRTHTAKTLGIGIRTLQRKLKQYKSSESPVL